MIRQHGSPVAALANNLEALEALPTIGNSINPEHRAWLPIMHVDPNGWHFTALFSNSLRAHELGRTDDWVVVYYERDREHGQGTVVSESSGPMNGKRVVRGREGECLTANRQASESTRSPHPRHHSELPRRAF